MKQFLLKSERLLLDSPTAADIDEITCYCQDPVFERFMTLPWPYRRPDAEYFVNELVPGGWASGEELTWAVRRAPGAPLLGAIGLRMPFSDVGFWLAAEHRGNGYMPETLALVTDWALGDVRTGTVPVPAGDATIAASPGLDAIGWECLLGNNASAAVARKSGFTFTGVAPSRLPYRDGSHPESWQGTLRAGADRQPKRGWPV